MKCTFFIIIKKNNEHAVGKVILREKVERGVAIEIGKEMEKGDKQSCREKCKIDLRFYGTDAECVMIC